jgi:3-polyprenyl-4-hydroxybenzoate decarboxylase
MIHHKKMEIVTLAGRIIYADTPSLYSRPKTIEDVEFTVVDRVIDMQGFDSKSFRWGSNS